MSGPILVFGRTGQVGAGLARLPGVLALPRAEADLADPDACAAAIRAHGPAAVINAAAWTAVDAAEDQAEAAHRINAAAPAAMAQAAARLGIPLVHISTDYVFDGTGDRPWTPADSPAPLGVYGRSKLAGERAVQAAGGVHAILRTSWVFSGRGQNFLRTMLRLGAERERITVVADQIGGPTPADAIAAACHAIAHRLIDAPGLSGTYHFAGAPDTSWAGFARAIMAAAGLACTVEDIPSDAWPTKAPRPKNSRLDCSGLEAAFGIPRPDWRAGIAAALAELQESPT
jgi:dTDP-4-dehydrorhamnose reductase